MKKASAIFALILGALTVTIPTYLLFQAVTYLFFIPLLLGTACIVLGLAARRSDSSYAGWVALVLTLVAVVVPFGLIAYHNRSGYPIVFVVSDEYSGPITLMIDRQRDVDIPLKDGRYTYPIPETGILVIKDDGPFSQWHTTTAFYANGRNIPMAYEDGAPSDAVLFHSVASGVRTRNGASEEFMTFYVGTSAGLRKHVDGH